MLVFTHTVCFMSVFLSCVCDVSVASIFVVCLVLFFMSDFGACWLCWVCWTSCMLTVLSCASWLEWCVSFLFYFFCCEMQMACSSWWSLGLSNVFEAIRPGERYYSTRIVHRRWRRQVEVYFCRYRPSSSRSLYLSISLLNSLWQGAPYWELTRGSFLLFDCAERETKLQTCVV